MKTKIIYYMRWIVSGFVMLPVMSWFESLGLSLGLNLFLGQSFGSLVFYNIDKNIFNKEE